MTRYEKHEFPRYCLKCCCFSCKNVYFVKEIDGYVPSTGTLFCRCKTYLSSSVSTVGRCSRVDECRGWESK